MRSWSLAWNERSTKLRPADLRRVVALTTGMLLFMLTFFPHRLHSHSNSSTVFCFTEQNPNSVSFSQSQCCRLLKVLLSRFLSEVDVVLGEVVHHKFELTTRDQTRVVSIFYVRMKFLK